MLRPMVEILLKLETPSKNKINDLLQYTSSTIVPFLFVVYILKKYMRRTDVRVG